MAGALVFGKKITLQVERKIESIIKMKRPENISVVRSLIGSFIQFLCHIPKWVLTTERYPNLMKKKHSRFK